MKTLLVKKSYVVLTTIISILISSCAYPVYVPIDRAQQQRYQSGGYPGGRCNTAPQFRYPQPQPYGYPQQGGYRQAPVPPGYYGGNYNGGPGLLSYSSGGTSTGVIRVGRSAKGKIENKSFLEGLAHSFNTRT